MSENVRKNEFAKVGTANAESNGDEEHRGRGTPNGGDGMILSIIRIANLVTWYTLRDHGEDR